jgi:tetratricopeptide (TPR) repeat protein
MHEIETLERRWKRYKRKKILTRAIVPILVLVFILTISFNKEWLVSHLYSVGADALVTNDAVDDASRDVAKPQESDTRHEVLDQNTSSLSAANPVETDAHTDQDTERKITIEVTETGKNAQISDLLAHQIVLQDVEERFARTENYEDSLYLAREYYREEEYRKAMQWALATNNLNSQIEESWLIFAKAKAKLGSKEEAINILTVYIKKTDSDNAKLTLKLINEDQI